ncbi:hypothetical protein ACQCSV_14765 [Pseudarthrobacter sp. S3]|uniref:hypothetical protein n=1 Tax=Pseudarthrobacter sp. S3 TaxID=3418419 RepID=UPI00339401E3
MEHPVVTTYHQDDRNRVALASGIFARADGAALCQRIHNYRDFEIISAGPLAARAAATGVLLAVDELQEAPKEDLEALNVALHQLGQDPRPATLMFLGTGLPSLPSVLSKASTYAERIYLYRTVGLLSDEDTKDALATPSQRERVTWSENALVVVLKASGGYPYFVQACGKHIWDVAASRTIDADDARIGIGRARDEVDAGLYNSRW